MDVCHKNKNVSCDFLFTVGKFLILFEASKKSWLPEEGPDLIWGALAGDQHGWAHNGPGAATSHSTSWPHGP